MNAEPLRLGIPLRLGSRKSPMAIAQSGDVARLITERTGRRVEIVGVTTLGDVSREQLSQIGGTGVFVSALRESLLRGEVDFAVHSLKDLPTGAAPGITLAATPARDDPRDALVGAGRHEARRPAARRAGRHRLAAPRGAAHVAPLRRHLRPHQGKREHPARQDARWRVRRGRARLRGPGQDRPHRRWSARSSSPTPCFPRQGRARSPSSAGRPTPSLSSCSAR